MMRWVKLQAQVSGQPGEGFLGDADCRAPIRCMLQFMHTGGASASAISLDDHRDLILDCVAANPFTLFLGCLAGIVFGFVGVVLTGIVRNSHAANPSIGWVLLSLSAVVLIATVRQLLWPIPLVEVTCRGVRLRIGAPMSRSGLFFVPWARLRAVILTQTVATNFGGGGRENALGFRIAQDERFRLPAVRWNSSHAAPEAPRCEVVFAASMVNGDVHECVRKIEEQRIRAVSGEDLANSAD